MDAEALVADYGPDQPVPFCGEVAEGVQTPAGPTCARRAEAAAERRAGLARARLGQPALLEEFSAMEERHKFLTEQLEDLRKTRKDLLDIVREVDQPSSRSSPGRTPTSAGRSTPRSRASSRGRGAAGPDRPRRHAGHRRRGRGPAARQEGQAGAAVRRRAVAGRGRSGRAVQGPPVAVLHPRRGRGGARRHQPGSACWRSYEELRENPSQLVITHQKRTMEVGDALYGVTMRGDGVSAVISQRLRDAESA